MDCTPALAGPAEEAGVYVAASHLCSTDVFGGFLCSALLMFFHVGSPRHQRRDHIAVLLGYVAFVVAD